MLVALQHIYGSVYSIYEGNIGGIDALLRMWILFTASATEASMLSLQHYIGASLLELSFNVLWALLLESYGELVVLVCRPPGGD